MKTSKAVKAPKAAPVAEAVQAPVAAVVSPATAPKATYSLSAKAAALASQGSAAGATLQRPAAGLGMAWRAPRHKGINTRAMALAAVLEACGDKFTAEQAHKALTAAKANGLHLGAGSPTSYVKAFIANGYFC
jgi:hypothetical protein